MNCMPSKSTLASLPLLVRAMIWALLLLSPGGTEKEKPSSQQSHPKQVSSQNETWVCYSLLGGGGVGYASLIIPQTVRSGLPALWLVLSIQLLSLLSWNLSNVNLGCFQVAARPHEAGPQWIDCKAILFHWANNMDWCQQSKGPPSLNLCVRAPFKPIGQFLLKGRSSNYYSTLSKKKKCFLKCLSCIVPNLHIC